VELVSLVVLVPVGQRLSPHSVPVGAPPSGPGQTRFSALNPLKALQMRNFSLKKGPGGQGGGSGGERFDPELSGERRYLYCVFVVLSRQFHCRPYRTFRNARFNICAL
jgi:hypothetical protein